MQSVQEYSGIAEVRFFRKLIVFPDGSRECSLQKVNWPPRVETGEENAWAKQCRLNRQAGRLETTEDKKQKNKERAVRRARRETRLLIRSLGADHMVTFTYRENMEDVERLKRNWKRFCELMHSRFPEWRYVAAFERQKRGAWHVHAAVKGWQNVNYLRWCWRTATGVDSNIDVKGEWRRGREKKTKEWTGSGLANYLSKYISKTFDQAEMAHKRRYWRSVDIAIPEAVEGYLDEEDWCKAVERTYMLVAEGRAQGVTQWMHHDCICYWIFSPGPPECPF